MARGDFLLFEEFADQLAKEMHNFNATDVFKLGIITSVATPLVGDTTPTWGDYSANEVGTGGGYPANGITITWSVATRWAEVGGTGTFDGDDITISQNGSGFTNAYWGILYNDTEATDAAIGFLEFAGPVSEQAGDVNINWNASGIFTIAV